MGSRTQMWPEPAIQHLPRLLCRPNALWLIIQVATACAAGPAQPLGSRMNGLVAHYALLVAQPSHDSRTPSAWQVPVERARSRLFLRQGNGQQDNTCPAPAIPDLPAHITNKVRTQLGAKAEPGQVLCCSTCGGSGSVKQRVRFVANHARCAFCLDEWRRPKRIFTPAERTQLVAITGEDELAHKAKRLGATNLLMSEA